MTTRRHLFGLVAGAAVAGALPAPDLISRPGLRPMDFDLLAAEPHRFVIQWKDWRTLYVHDVTTDLGHERAPLIEEWRNMLNVALEEPPTPT